MKKTLFFGLIAAALGFTACSSEDDAILGNNTQKKGMVLNATVEQPAETRATIDNSAANWQFAFAQNDEIKVTNSAVTSGTYYTFTNDDTSFTSSDATPTASAADWYAYFPSNTINLTNQAGTLEGVANLYALAGKTASATTGEGGLSIPMSAKVAILKINNQEGSINIQVKTSENDYVTGLSAKSGEAGFNVETSTTPTSLFSTTIKGTYYVAVPAGVKMAIKDGNNAVKSTKAEGLTAGKYYNLFLGKTGSAAATGIGNVNWVQLWGGGPRFAEYNVGATSATGYGGYYAWGGSQDKVDDHNTDASDLTGDSDTATKLWGSNWRMPTNAELQALIDKCDVEWTTVNGVNGLRFTGRGDYEPNSVFLPAAGEWDNNKTFYLGEQCLYWSSTPMNATFSYHLTNYYSEDEPEMDYDQPFYRYSVRAVLAE